MINYNRYTVIFSIVLVIVALALIASACTIGIGGGGEPAQTVGVGILAPQNNSRVLAQGPVQIQSAFENPPSISRVELFVQAAGQAEQLIRADRPNDDGTVLQQWVPPGPNSYTVSVVAYDANNNVINYTPDGQTRKPLTIQVEAVDDIGISLQAVPTATPILPQPTAQLVGGDAAAVFIAPVTPEATVAAAILPPPPPTATPTRYFPPPPPVPGVPKGPTQNELPELMPPTCNAAELLGPYVPNTSQRISITEPAPIPAQTVGGTQVHRGWRLQNIGTCTWGPGYELAFYGGRAMGSGGVSFEFFYPNEPVRRNSIENTDRLIVPEGKPNQVAIVELLLNAPVTPGIHQSYWRMRSPQGVYFGPIMGVTLEVVRECAFGIYGAPVINRFEILGVGNVFMPENPIEVQAMFGEPVTLDWSISNAQNYDIVVTSPTGSTANLATNSRTDRNTFIPDELGQWSITLYADNGSCTATADVLVNVVPPDDSDFFVLAVNSSAVPGATTVNWRHLDPGTDLFILEAQLYRRVFGEQCAFGSSALRSVGLCSDEWGAWSPVPGSQLPSPVVGVIGEELPTEIPTSAGITSAATTPILTATNSVQYGDVTIAQGSSVSAVASVGGTDDSEGSAVVYNIVWGLCPNPIPSNEDYGIRYQMRAEKEGKGASPPFSNPVDIRCGASSAGVTGGELTIAGNSANPPFNPD